MTEKDQALSDKYLAQATFAYESKNYKLCLILLRNVIFNDVKSTSLLVNCAYEYWKLGNDSMLSNQSNSAVEREENLQFVKESFSLLLSRSPHDKIRAFDYIRLTHIYLVEGGLDGALQILKLASARGHMLSSLIIIQSWTILKRIGSQKDADSCLQYLSSSIAMEPKSAPVIDTDFHDDVRPILCIGDSPLRISYAMLHCANFIKRKIATLTSKAAKEKEFNLMKSMVIEAYVLQTGDKTINDDIPANLRWYNDPKLWMDMGHDLEDTPFILLAEDSYWEAFLRDSSNDEPLKRIVFSMSKYRRTEKIPFLLAKAYEVNPWSLYARKVLADTEIKYAKEALSKSSSAKVSLPWNELFHSQHKDAIKVQAAIRQWIVKLHWPATVARQLARIAVFIAAMERATLNAAKLLKKFQVNVLREWRQTAVDIILFKNETATKIQTCWRRKSCMMLKDRTFHRVRRANALFIVTCQNKFDMERLLIFRRWFALFEERRKHKMATIIAKSIPLNSLRWTVKTAMKKLLPIIGKRKRRVIRAMMESWADRYQKRRKNHARITIRFFIRASFTRKERERQRLLLLQVEQQVQAKTQELVLNRDFTPLIREMWSKWRVALQKVYDHRKWLWALKTLQTILPMLHARKLARAVVRAKRVRLENQTAFVRLTWFRRAARVMIPWKNFVFASKIQRFVRCTHAEWKLRRLKNIKRNVKQFQRLSSIKKKERILFRWKKFLYLNYRIRYRATKRIVSFFRWIQNRAKLRRTFLRKIRMFNFLSQLHKTTTRHFFYRLANSADDEWRSSVMFKMLAAVNRGWSRRGFSRWRDATVQQNVASKLHDLFVRKRIRKMFFEGAENSAFVLKRKTALLGSKTYLDPSPQPWEVEKPSNLILLDERALSARKAFCALMASYRLRNRYLLGGFATKTALHFMKSLVTSLAVRRFALDVIQRFRRRIAAKIKLRNRLVAARKENEIAIILRDRWRLKQLKNVMKMASRRSLARWHLQGFGRRVLATRFVRERKAYLLKMEQLEAKLNTSLMQRCVVRKAISAMSEWCCVAIVRAIRANESLPFRTRTKKQTESKLSGTKSSKHSAAANSKEQHNTTRPNKKNDISNATLADRSKGHVFAGKPYRNLRQIVLSNSMEGLGKQTEKRESRESFSASAPLDALKSSSLSRKKPFQSVDLHAMLIQVKQSGVFLYDCEDQKLLVEEIEYFLQYVPSVFCQRVHSEGVARLKTFFRGTKLSIVGGELSESDVVDSLLPLFLKNSLSEEGSSGEKGGLIVQLNEVRLPFSAVVRISRALGEVQAPSSNDSCPTASHAIVKDLTIDLSSVGSLGLSVLLRCLQVRSIFSPPSDPIKQLSIL